MRTQSLTDTAMQALSDRGIDPDVAVRMGVESVLPKATDASPCDMILFPHMRHDTQVHWTIRTIGSGPKKFWQQPGGKRCLWNGDVVSDATLRGQTPLIITEGHLDALALMTVGFSAVVSVPDGAPGIGGHGEGDDDDLLAKKKYAYLSSIRDELREWPSVIVAADADEPGRRLLDDLARIIGRARVRVMEYGAGCKDANQLLIEGGPEALVAAVERAPWMDVGGIHEWDSWPAVDLPKAVDAGVPGIGGLWKFRPGELSVLVGIPGHGKSALANHIAWSLARNHDWVVCLFSPEQHPSIHAQRMLSIHLDKPQAGATAEQRKAASAWLREHFVLLAAERDAPPTVDWLRERIATVAWRYNCRLVIVDPWNQLDHLRPDGYREDEYEKMVLRLLGRTAVDCGVHIMILVHPRKPAEEAKAKPPTGYSISGSGHWLNRPDLGATIFRDDDDGVRFRCWKARYADGEWYDNGRTGEVTLRLSGYSKRFVSLEREPGS
jgi:twinkle protein